MKTCIKLFAIITIILFAVNRTDAQLLGPIKLPEGSEKLHPPKEEKPLPESPKEEKPSFKDSIKFVEHAVINGLFISRSSFQICKRDTKELFGLNNKKEFGTSYTLGVKVPGGYLLTDKAVRPWLYNRKYAAYSTNYDPLFYEARYASKDNDFKYDSLDFKLSEQKRLFDTTLYRFPSVAFSNKGFVLDTTGGNKEGFIVWVSNKDKNLDSITSIELSVVQKKYFIEQPSDLCQILEKPKIDGVVLGAIYVIPNYKDVGIIEFVLCGVCVETNGEWRIYFPFIDEDKLYRQYCGVSEEETLTPIEKKEVEVPKKDKKQKNRR